MRGMVIFLKTAAGTKSEALQPYLYLGMGEMLRVFKEGDNPYENESLRPFDRMNVSVFGRCDEDGILWIDRIAADEEIDATNSNVEGDEVQ